MPQHNTALYKNNNNRRNTLSQSFIAVSLTQLCQSIRFIRTIKDLSEEEAPELFLSIN